MKRFAAPGRFSVTTKPKRTFDAVRFMREARARLREELANKPFEE
jgi:hypothetical protein